MAFPRSSRTSSACARDREREPLVRGEHGRIVQEMLFAAYASAGQRRAIDFPFDSDAKRPIDLWRPSGA